MRKYRIVKYSNKYDTYYRIQKRFLFFFWVCITSGYSFTGNKIRDINEAKKLIKIEINEYQRNNTPYKKTVLEGDND